MSSMRMWSNSPLRPMLSRSRNASAIGQADAVGFVAVEVHGVGQLRPHDVAADQAADLVWPALPHDYYWSPYVRGELRVERAAATT